MPAKKDRTMATRFQILESHDAETLGQGIAAIFKASTPIEVIRLYISERLGYRGQARERILRGYREARAIEADLPHARMSRADEQKALLRLRDGLRRAA
jgi:hypothetical protein